MFTHMPGLRVVMPSNALDLCGLLRTAMRSRRSGAFPRAQAFVSQPYNRSPLSGAGLHDSVREGAGGARRLVGEHHHVWRVVHRAEVAAARIEREGVSVEVIDLRSLSTVRLGGDRRERAQDQSRDCGVRRHAELGYGAEIAARIAMNCSTIWTRRCGAWRRWIRSARTIRGSRTRFCRRRRIWCARCATSPRIEVLTSAAKAAVMLRLRHG
jgi:pyruvate/2-oxoglutarate/acetoin dehydrogenase E1 component